MSAPPITPRAGERPPPLRSRLATGRVGHLRLRPVRHALRYRVFSLLLDLDELPELDRRLRFFSVDRWNIFSLRQRDHGGGAAAGGLRGQVEDTLAAAGLQVGGRIRLLAMPRLFGHVFNPLSVYYCDRPDGTLQALLYEVDNTFGDRHSYLIPVDADAAGSGLPIEQRCAKAMHVSPFLGLDLEYRFRIVPPATSDAAFSIGIAVHDADGPVLNAWLDAATRPLTDAGLLRTLLSHPLVTLKVVVAIHWEALRLWWKGAPFHARPPAPARSISVSLPAGPP